MSTVIKTTVGILIALWSFPRPHDQPLVPVGTGPTGLCFQGRGKFTGTLAVVGLPWHGWKTRKAHDRESGA